MRDARDEYREPKKKKKIFKLKENRIFKKCIAAAEVEEKSNYIRDCKHMKNMINAMR